MEVQQFAKELYFDSIFFIMNNKAFEVEDLRRLNYIHYTSSKGLVKDPHSIIICYLLFFARLIYSFLFRVTKKNIDTPIFFFVLSSNNRRSIKSIEEHLDASLITVWNNSHKNLPWFDIYINSIKYLGTFHKLYQISSAEDRSLMRYCYKEFMTTGGMLSVMNKLLSNSPKLKLIVFANDHSTENRCLIEAANLKGIKTLYVQHASITERFPPLNFTYSFLDGMESLEKYIKIGNVKGRVFLSGSPRFDELAKYKNNEKIYDIGIALNQFDSLDTLEEIIEYLRNNSINRIIVRPHPMMKDFPTERFKRRGIIVSNSIKETSFDFISKLRIMVANESAIHLDAALMGVPSVLYNFSNGEILDWYAYFKNNLITMCSTPEELVLYFKNKHDIVQEDIVRYYDATYNTKYEGKIGSMIASFIIDLMKGNEKEWINNHKDICYNGNVDVL